MRKVILFIAMSLDGYIADKDDRVDWLGGQCSDMGDGDAYSEFIKDIDTVVMGWKTYHQVASELSPSEWVYQNLTSYVITHRENVSTKEIKFVNESPELLVQRLKEQCGKDIWICGGANIIAQLMSRGLIDKFHISIIPTILGNGIRLFGTLDSEFPLKLTEIKHYNGITEVIYEKR
ncbi:MAG: dihydrofolate reductase family protein [Lachnospiraceae bacterium]|nr:dihydrofolate reductase family protein [Lachnospiraceae bacterium]